MILADSMQGLLWIMDAIKGKSEKRGLTINVNKTKFMFVSKMDQFKVKWLYVK